MILKLIRHSQTLPMDSPENEGFDLSKIKGLLQQLERFGVAWEAVETDAMSEDELSRLYMEATLPAVYKKYQVRQVFGSKRNSGFLFGKGVPALIVYEPGAKHPSDVYPHRAGSRTVTIKAFLEHLLEKLQRTATKAERRKADKALVERMDRLREKIGPIGLPVADLIRQGKRR